MSNKKFKNTKVGQILGGLGRTADTLLTGGKLSGVIDSILGDSELSDDEKKTIIDELGLLLKDKADARAMHAEIQKSPNASWLAKNISSLIAIGVVLLFCMVHLGPMLGFAAVSDLAISGITNVLMVIVTFFFGSSLKQK